MSWRWLLLKRPLSTASEWLNTSASMAANSLNILLTINKSSSASESSSLRATSNCLTSMLRLKHLPKSLSQSIPKNWTLGSTSNPLRHEFWLSGSSVKWNVYVNIFQINSFWNGLPMASNNSRHCLLGSLCLQRTDKRSRASWISAPTCTRNEIKSHTFSHDNFVLAVCTLKNFHSRFRTLPTSNAAILANDVTRWQKYLSRMPYGGWCV